MAASKQAQLRALQRQLYRAWDRVHQHESAADKARREVQRLLYRKIELLNDED